MAKLTVHLLGQFQVLLNGKAITHFATDKVRALLAYLAIENQYPHRREKLATLFWPEKSESEARTNLRRALADLRTNIQDQAASPPFLLITRNDLQINLDSPITIDCLLLEQQAHHGSQTQQDMDQCDRLLALYRGDFLAGFRPCTRATDRLQIITGGRQPTDGNGWSMILTSLKGYPKQRFTGLMTDLPEAAVCRQNGRSCT